MKEGGANAVFVHILSACSVIVISGRCVDKNDNIDGMIFNKTYRYGKVLTCEKNIGMSMCIDTCAKLGGCSHVNFNKEDLSCALMSDDENLTHSGMIDVGSSNKMKDEIGNVFVLMNNSTVLCGTKVCREDNLCLETSSGLRTCQQIDKLCCKEKSLVPVPDGSISDRVTFSSNNFTDRNYYKPPDPGGWVPAVHDTLQWAQVIFQWRKIVTYVVTRGGGLDNPDQSWVSSYHIKYLRGDVWVYFRNTTGSIVTFPGNEDPDGRVKHFFARPFSTKGIQLRPQTWHNYIEMRFDVYGC